MTTLFLIRPIMNQPNLYPQYTPTLIPQMILPLKRSQSGLHLMISLPNNALLMCLSANALVILPPNLSMLGKSSITPLPTISLACHHKNMKSAALRRRSNSIQSLHTAEKCVMLLKPLTLLKPLLSTATGHDAMSQRKRLTRAPLLPVKASGVSVNSTTSSIYANNTV